MAFFFLINIITNGDFRTDLAQYLQDLGVLKAAVLVLLAVSPLLTVVTAVKTKLYQTPVQLGKLLFLFEVPLIFILLVALNSFANATAAMWFFLVMIILTFAVFFLDIFKLAGTSTWQMFVVVLLRQTALTTVGFLTVLYSFFLPLILGGLIKGFIPDIFDSFRYGISFSNFGELAGAAIFLIIGVAGILFSGFLLTVPYAITYLLLGYFRDSQIGLIARIGLPHAVFFNSLAAVIYLVILLTVSYQPSIDPYLEKLENLSVVRTFEAKEKIARELIPNESDIKRSLENMTNSRSRYLMAKSDDFLKSAYKDVFGLGDTMAQAVEDTFKTLAYPFIYQGSLDSQGKTLANF